jgi:glycosyltransferase involved in cell wall biosynthesis
MADRNLVAVVTPVFNSAQTLRPALLSVQRQSWPHLHVLVDDGSWDDSAAIIERFARGHPSVVLLRRERQPGDVFSSSNALNAGFRYVLEQTGAGFVTRHDSDDIMTRESLARRMAEFGEGVGAVYSWHDMFSGRGRFAAYSHKLRGTQGITKSAVFGRCFPYHTLVWRRSVLEEVSRLSRERGLRGDFYDTRLCFHEDLDFLFRMLDAMGRLGLGFGYVNEVTVHQRTHSRGITSRLGTSKAFRTTLDLWSRYRPEVSLPALAQAVEMVCIRPLYHHMWAVLKRVPPAADEFHVPEDLRWYEQGEGGEAAASG